MHSLRAIGREDRTKHKDTAGPVYTQLLGGLFKVMTNNQVDLRITSESKEVWVFFFKIKSKFYFYATKLLFA